MARVEGTLDNADLATSEQFIVLGGDDKGRRGVEARNILIRYYNDLDQDATVKVYGTTSDDASRNADGTWDLSGAGRWEQLVSKSVSTGATDFDTLTDFWEFIRIGVTPSVDPASGTFEVVSVRR